MIDAVIFDLDGTLVEQMLDFDAIRTEIGLPADKPILETMATLAPHERERADRILVRHEEEAAKRAPLAPGARQVLGFLAERGIPVAILTRNMRRSVELIIQRHGIDVDWIIAREDSAPKPRPDGVLAIAEALGVEPARCLMVGDYVFDIEAGRAAGAATVLVRRQSDQAWDAGADAVVEDLHELLALLKRICRR